MPSLFGSSRATALLVLLAVSCGGESAMTVSVAAASSLRDVLLAVEDEYERAHPGVDLEFSFAASSTHARQIAAGAQVDVFLSADGDNVERVLRAAKVESRCRFLPNALALVVWTGGPPVEMSHMYPGDVAGLEGALAVGAPSVPLGRYTRAWLEDSGLLESLEPKFVNGHNARATLALVTSGAARFGLVYDSDAIRAEGVQRWWQGEGAAGIEYEGIVLAAAGDEASAFLAWLVTPEFQGRAAEFGFRGSAEDER